MKQRQIRPGPGIPMQTFKRYEADERPEALEPVPAPADSPRPEAVASAAAQSTNRHIEINLELIDENPLAPREIYTDAMVEKIALELQSMGQNDPIHVIEHPDRPGRYMICDGWTRVLACRQYKIKRALLARVLEGTTPLQGAIMGYRQNEARNNQCDYDRAQFMQKLEDNKFAPEEIREALGINSRMQISRLRSYFKLPPDILEIVREHKDRFGASVVYEISQIHERLGFKKALYATSSYAEGNRTVDWLRGIAGKQRSERSPRSKPEQYFRCQGGYLKQFENKIQMDLEVPEGTPPEVMQKIQEAYREIERLYAAKEAAEPSKPEGEE